MSCSCRRWDGTPSLFSGSKRRQGSCQQGALRRAALQHSRLRSSGHKRGSLEPGGRPEYSVSLTWLGRRRGLRQEGRLSPKPPTPPPHLMLDGRGSAPVPSPALRAAAPVLLAWMHQGAEDLPAIAAGSCRPPASFLSGDAYMAGDSGPCLPPVAQLHTAWDAAPTHHPTGCSWAFLPLPPSGPHV